jgi:hypothetical protein
MDFQIFSSERCSLRLHQPEYPVFKTHKFRLNHVSYLTLEVKGHTYISESLKEKLSLQVVRSNTLMVETFGSTSEQIQECPLVECIVNSRHDNSSLCINTYAVPAIGAPLNGQINNCEARVHSSVRTQIGRRSKRWRRITGSCLNWLVQTTIGLCKQDWEKRWPRKSSRYLHA